MMKRLRAARNHVVARPLTKVFAGLAANFSSSSSFSFSSSIHHVFDHEHDDEKEDDLAATQAMFRAISLLDLLLSVSSA
jgi:hypothetical protein